MSSLIWIGATVTCLGILGLLWCGVAAARVRRDATGGQIDEAALKARLQRLIAVNLGALGVAALGLMTLIVGLALG